MKLAFSGATVTTVIDRSSTVVPEHSHDWPVLSLFVMGNYQNETDGGTATFSGPSAVLYRAGQAHKNLIGGRGFEQIEIEFDPDWLGPDFMPDAPVVHWANGRAASSIRGLLALARSNPDEKTLRDRLRGFCLDGASSAQPKRPAWIGQVTARLEADPTLRIKDLAADISRHPAWVGAAYARAVGESLPRMAARLKMEHAAYLLRESEQTSASIAAEAGFADQSHMIRTFHALLSRGPREVRDERRLFR